MTTFRLDWQALLPESTKLAALCSSSVDHSTLSLADIQPRLTKSLSLFCQHPGHRRFMLINAEEHHDYLAHIAQIVSEKLPPTSTIRGVRYQIHADGVGCRPATNADDNFASQTNCAFVEWIESESLFGCLRKNNQHYQLTPGLVHQTNGGILILPLRTLLVQPLLWLRLKQIINSQLFQWRSLDESRPLPINIPDMLLDLRLILVGNRSSLDEFELLEAELTENAFYGEFEAELTLEDHADILHWCRYVRHLAQQHHFPELDNDIWLPVIQQAIRYTSDQKQLPLCPLWIRNCLENALPYSSTKLTASALEQAYQDKSWRENYLTERSRQAFMNGQIQLLTEGEIIGQINGLSVLHYPAHPQAIGEPSRITCVAHLGDGDITDVERKAELGGNIHAKGMMIMSAFLIAELQLDQQFPFSSSIVFEQSYGEVDGDSASLAELCALISALAQQPISQQVAVTGSIDQFGNVQPIGGINEKIEGFFAICQQRGLSGQQGIILPVSNLQNLCLNADVVAAVREGVFHLWSVETVADALPILTGLPLRDDQNPSLLAIIRERIAQTNAQGRQPWFLRWLTRGK